MSWKYLGISWLIKPGSNLDGKDQDYLLDKIPSLLPYNWKLLEVQTDYYDDRLNYSLRFQVEGRISEDAMFKLEKQFNELDKPVNLNIDLTVRERELIFGTADDALVAQMCENLGIHHVWRQPNKDLLQIWKAWLPQNLLEKLNER